MSAKGLTTSRRTRTDSGRRAADVTAGRRGDAVACRRVRGLARSGGCEEGCASPGGGRSPGTGGRGVVASAGSALNDMRQRLACLTQSVMVAEETMRGQNSLSLEKTFNRSKAKRVKTRRPWKTAGWWPEGSGVEGELQEPITKDLWPRHSGRSATILVCKENPVCGGGKPKPPTWNCPTRSGDYRFLAWGGRSGRGWASAAFTSSLRFQWQNVARHTRGVCSLFSLPRFTRFRILPQGHPPRWCSREEL